MATMATLLIREVSAGNFEIDDFMAKNKIDKIDLLHSDIQEL